MKELTPTNEEQAAHVPRAGHRTIFLYVGGYPGLVLKGKAFSDVNTAFNRTKTRLNLRQFPARVWAIS